VTPRFTSFRSGDSAYELKNSGPKSSIETYRSTTPEWRESFEEYSPPKPSFIPCPFCENQNAVFTFRHSQETGTNTSGGVDSITYEVHCPDCAVFSLFEREDVSYPYD